MSSLQAVILLAAGFLVAWGLMTAWDSSAETAQTNADLTIRGQFLRPAGQGGASGNGAEIRRRPLPTETIEGVAVRPDGAVVSTPVTVNADGLGNGVTNAEQDRNLNAIEVAVAQSPLGIAVVGGDHVGGPSALDLGALLTGAQAFDHVAIAVRVGDRVEILEMIPDELKNSIIRNIGGASPGPRTPSEFARGYDTIHAVPIAGITPEQAARFVAELRRITAEGQNYGFVVGHTCATAIAEALDRAGILSLDQSTGANDLLPRSVFEALVALRNTLLGQAQLAGRSP
jgi:hypothetical protein